MGNVKKGAAEERHYLYVTMHRSNLPDAKGRWLARTANNRTLDIDAVCGSMITRGHSTGNHDEMITIVRRFFNEAAYLLADGFAVNRPAQAVNVFISIYLLKYAQNPSTLLL